MSIARAFAAMDDMQVLTDTCDACLPSKRTFVMADRDVHFVTDGDQQLVVDVGGFCGTCLLYLCPRHVVLMPPRDDPQEKAFIAKSSEILGRPRKAQVLGCRQCNEPLVYPDEAARERLHAARHLAGLVVDAMHGEQAPRKRRRPWPRRKTS